MRTFKKEISKSKFERILYSGKEDLVILGSDFKEVQGRIMISVSPEDPYFKVLPHAYYSNGFVYTREKQWINNEVFRYTYWRYKVEPVKAFSIDVSYHGEVEND